MTKLKAPQASRFVISASVVVKIDVFAFLRVKLNNARFELVTNEAACLPWVMIGTSLDHTALSFSGAYSSECSFNCAALHRQPWELDWGGKGGFLHISICRG